MKKYLLVFFLSTAALTLLSWGYVGHQTVARIAENHLTPQAKAAVHALLGSESIVEIASWADEVRNDPEYKSTAGWHFLNLPLGLDRAAFEKAVRSQSKENVYSAILSQEEMIKNPSSTNAQKAVALKFLVHFAGDAHQPMHISRAEDKGGNTIQVQYGGKGTNLHSLWDSRLIDQQGLGYSELASKVDQATPAITKQGQITDPMAWVWESYQVSSKLYPEVEKSNKLGEDYYTSHIGIVDERLELAGLRLAGVLNALFKNMVIPAGAALGAPTGTATERTASASPQKSTSAAQPEAATSGQQSQVPVQIEAKDAMKYAGKRVSLTAKSFSHRDMGSMALVNLGAEYPNQTLTLVLRGKAKLLAESIDGKLVTITGTVIEFKGRPEIEVREAAELVIK